jgi:hypothetical protein
LIPPDDTAVTASDATVIAEHRHVIRAGKAVARAEAVADITSVASGRPLILQSNRTAIGLEGLITQGAPVCPAFIREETERQRATTSADQECNHDRGGDPAHAHSLPDERPSDSGVLPSRVQDYGSSSSETG